MDNLADTPDEMLEQLRCSQCKKYLSCGPVRSLLDGTCICGRCSPSNTNTEVHRVLALEVVLKRIQFPCCFKERGCKECLTFDQAIKHELKCSYRSFPCPLSVFLDCTWNGSALQIEDHFTKKHTDYLLKHASFTIKINKTVRGTFAVVNEGVVFLVTYLYQASTRNLNFDVRYFNATIVASVSYYIQLCNNLNTKFNINLKETPCPLFDETYNNPGIVLNLSKYLETLDDPSKVKVNLQVSKLQQKAVDEIACIDYNKLDTLRCGKCRAYLALPIFENREKKGSSICYECAYEGNIFAASTDVELQQCIAETFYPCQWRSCSFISKGNSIREHEKSCHLRDYRCCFPSCSSLYRIAAAKEHLLDHGAKYMRNNMYRISGKRINRPLVVFMIENNRLFVVKHEVFEGLSQRVDVLFDSFVDQQKTIHLEHDHCKLRSRKLYLRDCDCFYGNELPSCFVKDDLLYVKLSY